MLVISIGDLYLAIGKGYLILSIGLGLGIGAPLAGWVIDTYDDYDIIFYLAGQLSLYHIDNLLEISHNLLG